MNLKYHILCIYRGDQDGLVPALPGGMVDIREDGTPETFNNTCKRELCEEAIHDDCNAIDELKCGLDNGTIVYTGIAPDPRNTNNAWIETCVIHAHIEESLAERILLRKDGTRCGETKGAFWLKATFENLTSSEFVKYALQAYMFEQFIFKTTGEQLRNCGEIDDE